MGKPYRECPHCGAHLDAGERCDCGEPEQQEQTAAEERPRMRLIAVCREVDKDTGRIAVQGHRKNCFRVRRRGFRAETQKAGHGMQPGRAVRNRISF